MNGVRGRGVLKRRIDPKEANRAIKRLLNNPDDTAQVFAIIRALTGDSFERLFQRTLADPEGRRVLETRTDLVGVLEDRERLRSMPIGSLGRTYVEFVEREHISASGLVDASDQHIEESVFLDPRAKNLSDRLRDAHDIWHVVTGYGRDLLGEGSLLAFTCAQVRNPGVAFIVIAGLIKLYANGHKDAPRLFWQGFRRGLRARNMTAVDWEGWLERPLEEIRAELRVDAPPVYEPLFSEAAAALH
ncbi:MAG TPA: Coq4 family protein [Candidatus Limnocylindrales bacterium]|nr:Coq4 family protein [Candidatus Limnocylindrales bacterium]